MNRKLRLENEAFVGAEFERLLTEAPRFHPFYLRAGWTPPWPSSRQRDAGEVLNAFLPWTAEGVVIPWAKGGSRSGRELFAPEVKRLWLDTQKDGVPLAARLKIASAWDLSSVHEPLLAILRGYDHWDPTTGVGLPVTDEGLFFEEASQDLRDLVVYASLALARRLADDSVASSRDDLRHLGRLCLSRGDFAGLECAARLERLLHELELDVWNQGEPTPYDGASMWAHLSAQYDLWRRALHVPGVLARLEADPNSPVFCAGLTGSAIHARLWQRHFDEFDEHFARDRLEKVVTSPCQATWVRRHLEGAPVWAPVEDEDGPNGLRRRDLWLWRALFPRWSRWLSGVDE